MKRNLEESNKIVLEEVREFNMDILEQIYNIIMKMDKPLGGEDSLIDNEIHEVSIRELEVREKRKINVAGAGYNLQKEIRKNPPIGRVG